MDEKGDKFLFFSAFGEKTGLDMPDLIWFSSSENNKLVVSCLSSFSSSSSNVCLSVFIVKEKT